MGVRIDISRKDYWVFNKYAMTHKPALLILTLAIFAGIPVLFLIKLGRMPSLYPWISIFSALLLGLLFDIFAYFFLKGFIWIMPSNKPGLLGEHFIEITDAGLRETTAVNDSFYYWEGIQSIKQDSKYIYIFVNSIMAHIIPKRSFSTRQDAELFFKKAVEFRNKDK